MISTIIFFASILSLLSWGLMQLAQEAVSLGRNAHDYITLNLNEILKAFDSFGNFYQNLDPSILSPVENNVSSSITKLSNATVSITGTALAILLNLVASVSYILLVIVFTMLATISSQKTCH